MFAPRGMTSHAYSDPGHVAGLVGQFYVKNAYNKDEDPFQAIINAAVERMRNPNATVLKRRILSPKEWLDDPYYSGSLKREYWQQKQEDFIEAASGDYTVLLLTGCIGWGKCLVGETECFDAETGKRTTVREQEGRTPLVHSVDENGRAVLARAELVWRSGEKRCARLELASGHAIEGSLDHPVLTARGYVPLAELTCEDLVAVSRNVPEPVGRSEFSDDEVIVAGYLLADGAVYNRTPAYHKGDRALVDDFLHHCKGVPGFAGAGYEQFGRGDWEVLAKGIAPWVRALGIDSLSKHKRVPGAFYGLPTRQVGLLLSRLYTDGCVYAKSPRKIEITLASEGLIDDIRFLLARIGVRARKRFTPKRATAGGELHDAWTLVISSAEEQRKFLGAVGVIPGKEPQCALLAERIATVRSNTNVDVVPITRKQLNEIRKELGISVAEMQEYCTVSGRSYMSTGSFGRLCKELAYDGKYAKYNSSDVAWERVHSITETGVKPVWDVSVPGPRNFVANGIVVHNTELLKGIVLYDAYRISCLDNPHRYLNIRATERIAMVLVGQNLNKVKTKLYDPIKRAVSQIPYFRDEFRHDPKHEAELRFPNGLVIKPGVTGEAAVHSEDVILLGLTEANFLPVIVKSRKKRGIETLDVAADLIEATKRRMKSRFLQGAGQLPFCRIVVDSSRQYPEDYVEREIAAIERGEAEFKSLVISRSQWEAKKGVRDAAGALLYSGQTFPVEVGDSHRFSRVLEPEEVPRARGRIVNVPVELRQAFLDDLEGALRDLAGIAVDSLHPLMPDRLAIFECSRDEEKGDPPNACDHPFTAETTTLHDAVRFIDEYLFDMRAKRPLVDPYMQRTAHADIGLTNDCMGLAVGHVVETVRVVRSADGLAALELPCETCRGAKVIVCPRCSGTGMSKQWKMAVRCAACRKVGSVPCPNCRGTGIRGVPVDRPRVYIDLMLRITPPPHGQIQFDDVEALLKRLRNNGMRIPIVTADGTESANFLQRQVAHQGAVIAEKLSVDVTKDPYYNLRNAITDKDSKGRRRLSVYQYAPFIAELSRLEDQRDKVDHPHGGSKDVSDAVAGVVYNCDRFTQLHVPIGGANLSIATF